MTVVKDGQFESYAWIAKVDPDTVFLPTRLRSILHGNEQATAALSGSGVWLNNCALGLHGPLEVLSRRAVAAYGAGAEKCESPPEEDVYLHQCLRSLTIQQLNQYDLLADRNCNRKGWEQSPEWQSCR